MRGRTPGLEARAVREDTDQAQHQRRKRRKLPEEDIASPPRKATLIAANFKREAMTRLGLRTPIALLKTGDCFVVPIPNRDSSQ